MCHQPASLIPYTFPEKKQPSLRSRTREGFRGATLVRLKLGVIKKQIPPMKHDGGTRKASLTSFHSLGSGKHPTYRQLLYSDNGVSPARANLKQNHFAWQFRGPFNFNVWVRIPPFPHSLNHRFEIYYSSSKSFDMQLTINLTRQSSLVKLAHD
jgi:hypothetical protein